MLTRNDIINFRDRMRATSGPLLSLYMPTGPRHADNRKHRRLRARETLLTMEIPHAVADRVFEYVAGPTRADRHRTEAIFSSTQIFETMALPARLPVTDPQTGHLLADWGPAMTAPLDLALTEFKDVALISVETRSCRMFRVFMGQIEQLSGVERKDYEAEVDVLERPRQMARAYLPTRGDGARDKLQAKEHSWTIRFYNRAICEIQQLYVRQRFDGVILAGSPTQRKLFLKMLPSPLHGAVLGEVGYIGIERPAEIIESVNRVTTSMRAHEVRRLLDRVEVEGVSGPSDCLDALERGRMDRVILPWKPSAHDNHRQLETITDLAEQHSTRLAFARGENRRRLAEDLSGIAGVLRWR